MNHVPQTIIVMYTFPGGYRAITLWTNTNKKTRLDLRKISNVHTDTMNVLHDMCTGVFTLFTYTLNVYITQ